MLLIATDIDKQLAPIFEQLKKFNPSEQTGSRIIREVALTAMAEIRERIQNRGEATQGGDIGKYSRDPMYVPVSEMVGKKLRPDGKEFNGKRRSTFASGKRKGKAHSSRYFEDGYDQYKSEIGRNTLGKVNLTLSGQLFNQLRLFPTSQGWGMGWSGSELAERAEDLTIKYRKQIFSPSSSERENAVKLATKLTADAISR